MPYSATLDFKISMSQSKSNNVVGDLFFQGDFALSQTFGDGVTANNFDRGYIGQRSVASASNDDMDLNGIITDAFGAAISAVELVAIVLMNRPRDPAAAANTTNLTLGVGSNPVVGYMGGTTPTIGPMRPGNLTVLMNPDASGLCTITAGTGDILRVANSSGATNNYCIALLMRSS